jgi:hypothetical protein
MAEPTAQITPPKRADEFADYRHPDEASFDKFVAALDRAYHRPFVMMWRGFLYGIATALGATVGAGIVLVILFYILRSINFAPFITQIQDIIIPESIRQQLEGQQPGDQSSYLLQGAYTTRS